MMRRVFFFRAEVIRAGVVVGRFNGTSVHDGDADLAAPDFVGRVEQGLMAQWAADRLMPEGDAVHLTSFSLLEERG